MTLLLVTSLIWAFSFGIVKEGVAGLDPATVAFLRLALAFAAFLPFLRIRRLARASVLAPLLAIGAVQYGLMYALYLASFQHLLAHEVALSTVFTPIYVVLLDRLGRRPTDRTATPRIVLALACAVGGSLAVLWRPGSAPHAVEGFLLVQGSNLAFAWGQLRYRRFFAAVAPRGGAAPFTDRDVFAVLYAGGALLALIPAAGGGHLVADLASIDRRTAAALLYLGLVASALGFFLWNAGARRVSTPVLAVLNDLKVPLAALVSVVFFGETADPWRLSAGLVLTGLAPLLVRTRALPADRDPARG